MLPLRSEDFYKTEHFGEIYLKFCQFMRKIINAYICNLNCMRFQLKLSVSVLKPVICREQILFNLEKSNVTGGLVPAPTQQYGTKQHPLVYRKVPIICKAICNCCLCHFCNHIGTLNTQAEVQRCSGPPGLDSSI